MRVPVGIGLAALVAVLAGLEPRAQGCAPLGKVQFICDVVSPEDFAIVPGSDWLIASGNRPGEGAIRAVNTHDQGIVTLYPSAAVKVRPDTKAYTACPGPLNPAEPVEKATFAAHGLYLKPGSRSTHTLYVVHHGARESIEIFEIDGAANPPALTWVGCVLAPPDGNFNAVVALPDGGIAVTNRPGTTPGKPASPNAATQAGAVWEWHAETGWRAVPGSGAMGINGLEISRDGQWFYIAGWGEQVFIRLKRGGAAVVREAHKVPYRIDNLRLTSDGTLFFAGHSGTVVCSCPTEYWHVGTLDPVSLKIEEIVSHPFEPGFGNATVAVRAGSEIWIGTNRGSRLGHFPAP